MGVALIESQPTMAPLFNLVNTAVMTAEKCDKQNVRLVAKEVRRAMASVLNLRGREQLITHISNELRDGMQVMTNSYSSTLFQAFKRAVEEGKQFGVIVPEGRPILEGRKLAGDLGALGIHVTLTTDAAAPGMIGECDAVFLGADAIVERGVINKTGSLGIGLAARESEVPLIIACERNKFLPAKYRPSLPIVEHDWAELLPKRLKNVAVRNVYFELLPYKFLQAIYTEEGAVRPRAIQSVLKNMPVSFRLLEELHY